MIHSVDQGNIAIYEKPFKTVASWLNARLARYPSDDQPRGVCALPHDAPEFVYALSLLTDETPLHCVRAHKAPGRRALDAEPSSGEVWALDLIEGPEPRPSDGALTEIFVGALEHLLDLGATGATCQAEFLHRIGLYKLGALEPADGGRDWIRLALDPIRLEDLAKTEGLVRPVAYRVDAEELSAFQSLAALERVFGELRQRLSNEREELSRAS